MIQYPYSSSQILTDTIFAMYGGQIGSSTSQQREVAYLLAEEQMTENLSTFLVPTTITGTVSYLRNGAYETEYGNVTQVFSGFVERIKQTSPLTLETFTGDGLVLNANHGYIGLYFDYACGGCGGGLAGHKYYASYESGLSSGTSNQPSMLLALTLAAQITLNFLDISLSNEGVADIGIQNFSNQSYAEARVKLGNNVFGNSAMAQKIKSLTKKYRAKSGMSFH